MKKPCCSIWADMGKAISIKEKENINISIEKSGLPSFVFAPTLEFLDNMLMYCPTCGESRDGVAKAPANTNIVKQEELVPENTTPVPTNKPRRCRACGGSGFIDKSRTTKCMQCLGKGSFTKDHVGILNGNFNDLNKESVNQAASDVRSSDDGFKEIGNIHLKPE